MPLGYCELTFTASDAEVKTIVVPAYDDLLPELEKGRSTGFVDARPLKKNEHAESAPYNPFHTLPLDGLPEKDGHYLVHGLSDAEGNLLPTLMIEVLVGTESMYMLPTDSQYHVYYPGFKPHFESVSHYGPIKPSLADKVVASFYRKAMREGLVA